MCADSLRPTLFRPHLLLLFVAQCCAVIEDDKTRNEFDELVKKAWAEHMAAMKQEEAKIFAQNYAQEISPQLLAEYRTAFDTIDLGMSVFLALRKQN